MSVDYSAYTVLGVRYRGADLTIARKVTPSSQCCIDAESAGKHNFCPECGAELDVVEIESLVDDGEIAGLSLDVVCGTDALWVYVGRELGCVLPYDDDGGWCSSGSIDMAAERGRILEELDEYGIADPDVAAQFGLWTVLVCS